MSADLLRIGRHETPEVGGVVPGPKVIEAGFSVAFFAGEFEVLGRAVAQLSLTAKGIIVGLVLAGD
jgi:hypothetical protein